MPRKKGYRAKVKFTAKEAGQIIVQAIPCLLLILIGGIIFGVFTATEGSVVAVVYSLCLSLFVYKLITIKEIPKILKDFIVSNSDIWKNKKIFMKNIKYMFHVKHFVDN